MFGFLTSLFSGGAVKAIENIASEAIETQKETAEARALWIKTLDPNGLMRRQLSLFASRAYGFYLAVMLGLLIMHFFGIGDAQAASRATDAIKELFLPITTAWGTIVTASFGVNGLNSYKGK